MLLPWSAEAHAKATPTDGSFAGRVSIRGGREVYLVCRGTRRPTALLVVGPSNRADIWSTPDEGDKPTMVQLDQSGQVRAAIKRVVRAVRAGKRTTGHLVAIRW